MSCRSLGTWCRERDVKICPFAPILASWGLLSLDELHERFSIFFSARVDQRASESKEIEGHQRILDRRNTANIRAAGH